MTRVGPTQPAEIVVAGRRSVADLIWLANTRHGPAGHWHARVRGAQPGHDHLETPEAAVAYLVGHRVDVPDDVPSGAELAELRRVRDAVQALVDSALDASAGGPSADPLHGLADLFADADLALDPSGRLTSRRPGWAGFVRDLLVPAIAIGRERGRLRRCDNPNCRLVFLDGSRNRARRWCDDAGCSNRARVRRARGRARAA